MPEGSNEKNKVKLTSEGDAEAELKDDTLNSNSSPLPGPVPEVEQEPQTGATAPSARQNTPRQDSAETVTPASQPTTTGGNLSSKKKKWIIGGIIAGALALLVGGGVVGYFVYQNPDKVIADGVMNLFVSQPGTVKASLSAENNDAKMNFALDMKGSDKIAAGTLTVDVLMKSQQLNFKVSADITATADGEGYLKLNDVDQLAGEIVDSIVDAQAKQYRAFGVKITEAQIKEQKNRVLAQLKPVIEKINNRWIKFTAKPDDDASEQQKCLSDAFAKLQSDRGVSDELMKAYADNKFFSVKEQLGVKDGSYGFVLDFDEDKAHSFGKAAERSALFKELQKCEGFSSGSSSTTPSRSGSDNVKDMHVELWVSQWSHQITSLKLSGTDTSSSTNPTKVSFDLTMDYEKVDGIEVPKDAVDFKELERELQQLSPAVPPRAGSSAISI